MEATEAMATKMMNGFSLYLIMVNPYLNDDLTYRVLHHTCESSNPSRLPTLISLLVLHDGLDGSSIPFRALVERFLEVAIGLGHPGLDQ
jgi:hypothetical protein